MEDFFEIGFLMDYVVIVHYENNYNIINFVERTVAVRCESRRNFELGTNNVLAQLMRSFCNSC